METFLISWTDTIHPTQGTWMIPSSLTSHSAVIVPSVATDDLNVQEMSSSWILSI